MAGKARPTRRRRIAASGFTFAALDTAGLTPGSRVDFTWRFQKSGEWAGSDITVRVLAAEPIDPGDRSG